MDEDIEMDEEQEQERADYDEQEDDQEDEQEGSEDGQDEEVDIDEGDDEEDQDADDDGDGDRLDEDEDDRERGSPSERGRRGSSARFGHTRPLEETALSATTYLRKVQERRKLFQPSVQNTETRLGYQIEPIAAAPHSCHIHAMSLSLDGQTLVTGGSDGFVRKYDVNATMNGKVMLTQNVRHGFVEGITRGGVLSAFWPNEEQPPAANEKDRLVGVVHSLAMQQDALWSLSGSESGNIHLSGLRHDPGTIRHVFRKHKGVVSALAVASDDKHMISGGWDRDVHQWDLNTGQIVRSFSGHAGQISSIAFRPMSSSPNGASQSGFNASADDTDQDTEAKLPSRQNGSNHADVEMSAEPASPEKAAETISDSKPSAPPDQTVDLTADSPDSDIVMLDKDPKSPTEPKSHPKVKQEPPASDKTPTPSPAAASSAPANGGDDPTEEELAFEAELNASLGLALEGSATTKADGSQYGSALLQGGISAKPESADEKGSRSTGNGLVMAGADEDDAEDDDLFGGETPTPSVSGERRSSATRVKTGAPPAATKRSDSDGDDSLFGDGDEDADADMDGMEADADGDNEDASSDEDLPLAGRAMAKSSSAQAEAHDNSTIFPSSAMFPSQGTASGLASPALPQPAANPPSDAKPETSTTKEAPAVRKALPKPAFGGFGIASSFDAPINTFSPDVMMTSTLSGQAILWDLRCPSYTDDLGKARGVHSLPLPEKTSPWCQSSVFSSDGSKVYVGRKNESVDEWDLRMPRLARSLKLPSGSGPVYSLATMPNSRHIICASYDNIRLWDTQFVPGTGSAGELRVPFKIVAGHHGASVSSLLVDPSCRFLISASGDRGWMGLSTEAVILHDIKALY